jgi:hypothetical protein
MKHDKGVLTGGQRPGYSSCKSPTFPYRSKCHCSVGLSVRQSTIWCSNYGAALALGIRAAVRSGYPTDGLEKFNAHEWIHLAAGILDSLKKNPRWTALTHGSILESVFFPSRSLPELLRVW